LFQGVCERDEAASHAGPGEAQGYWHQSDLQLPSQVRRRLPPRCHGRPQEDRVEGHGHPREREERVVFTLVGRVGLWSPSERRGEGRVHLVGIL
jgi:hypothetical protein